ncbi:hypothetical protein CSC33_3882 [Pseudomonas aeruginosa]|nr:hypothetical protein CSC33_3882 [Pseudomonas aeruginosa]
MRPTKVRSAAGDAKLKNLTTPIRNINAPHESQKEIKNRQPKSAALVHQALPVRPPVNEFTFVICLRS